jgi:hypothetical protein
VARLPTKASGLAEWLGKKPVTTDPWANGQVNTLTLPRNNQIGYLDGLIANAEKPRSNTAAKLGVGLLAGGAVAQPQDAEAAQPWTPRYGFMHGMPEQIWPKAGSWEDRAAKIEREAEEKINGMTPEQARQSLNRLANDMKPSKERPDMWSEWLYGSPETDFNPRAGYWEKMYADQRAFDRNNPDKVNKFSDIVGGQFPEVVKNKIDNYLGDVGVGQKGEGYPLLSTALTAGAAGATGLFAQPQDAQALPYETFTPKPVKRTNILSRALLGPAPNEPLSPTVAGLHQKGDELIASASGRPFPANIGALGLGAMVGASGDFIRDPLPWLADVGTGALAQPVRDAWDFVTHPQTRWDGGGASDLAEIKKRGFLQPPQAQANQAPPQPQQRVASKPGVGFLPQAYAADQPRLAQSIDAAQSKINAIEAFQKRLQAVDRANGPAVKKVQEELQAYGLYRFNEAGKPVKPDSIWSDGTTRAVAELESKRAELEKQISDMTREQAIQDTTPSADRLALREVAPNASAVAAFGIGAGTRFAAAAYSNWKYGKGIKAAEKLITEKIMGKASDVDKAARINRYARYGSAKPPFELFPGTGNVIRPTPKPTPSDKWFPKRPEAAWSDLLQGGAVLPEVGITGYLGYENKKELERAREIAKQPNARFSDLAKVQELEDRQMLYDSAFRGGLGYMGGYGSFTPKFKYTSPLPNNLHTAQKYQGLLYQSLAKKK